MILVLVDDNSCLASANTVKIMLLLKPVGQNGHHISPTKQIVYGCFLLMFENEQFRDLRQHRN